jgi:hypothetical protein
MSSAAIRFCVFLIPESGCKVFATRSWLTATEDVGNGAARCSRLCPW